jgi:hypothetical protein
VKVTIGILFLWRPLPVKCGKAPSGLPDLQTKGEREEGEEAREKINIDGGDRGREWRG